MSASHHDPLSHPEVQLASGRGYVANFLVTTLLMGFGLWLSVTHAVAPLTLVAVTSGIAAVAVGVQAYLLLHMNLSEAQIWHTVAMILFLPLFVVTIGLTAWMFHGLYARTMIMSPHIGAFLHR